MSDPDKARHYLELLDAARCDARWQEIPELVRKIGKHATQRQCLCLTAQTEFRIASLDAQRLNTSSSSSSFNSPNLSQAITPIQNAIQNEKTFPEDQFQARVCVAWIHSVLNEPNQVLLKLPAHEIVQAIDRFTNIVSPTAKWTHVCIVKGAYLRGIAVENSGNTKEAAHFYESILSYLSKTKSTVGNTLESNVWTERLLARHAALASRHVKSNIHSLHVLLKSKTFQPDQLLGSFRLWSEYRSERQNGTFFTLAWVWKAYYDVLSILLQCQITKPIFQSRVQECAEVQKIQTAYEAIMMMETHFPQANQSNDEIDSWVDQVMANWRAMLAPPWHSEDLGQGGYAGMGKNVLDILYRSATRSFHSPKILRHLFIVHSALGEFKLAEKALDTYLEIVSKGKARTEKSGEIETGMDDDATALCTAAEGIKMLCKYGNRAEIEKTRQVVEILQKWLSKVLPDSLDPSDSSNKFETHNKNPPDELAEGRLKSKPRVPGRALTRAYHAIGISQSCWSRSTYEASSRSDLLVEAISNFRAALRPEYGNQDDIDVLCSLAYAFAEERDIDSAITTIKEAISVGSAESTQIHGSPAKDNSTNCAKREILLKCWHLLALLLSARQNFETALASCEAAEDLYGGKATLSGDTSALTTTTIHGLTLSERKGLIELKMTQLALSEVIEGPEEAVNSSGELVGLYAKLFKYSEKATTAILESTRLLPKSNTNSPQRSIRGSILGFPKDRKSRVAADNTPNASVGSFEPPNEITGTPAIAITSDSIILPQDPTHHQSFLGRHESNKLKKRHSRKSLQGASQHRSRTSSPLRPATSDGSHGHHSNQGRNSGEGTSNSLSPHAIQGYAANEVGVAISHDMPSSPPTFATDHSNPIHNISSASENMDHQNPNTQPVAPKPPATSSQGSIALFDVTSLPDPQYPPQVETRHALSLLAKIWCQISGIYRRAGLASDSQGAIKEARTHIEVIEMAIATQEGSSVENFSSPGHGGLSSLSGLWGDLLAEAGALYESLGETAKASDAFETALRWDPNHAGATVRLSTILLDLYEAKITNANSPGKDPKVEISSAKPTIALQGSPILKSLPTLPNSYSKSLNDGLDRNQRLYPDLNVLSARDRAYKLLSSLTKSGCGWDDSEAWYALARAHELSGQIDKAKEALWWVVELEEGRGVRRWNAACII